MLWSCNADAPPHLQWGPGVGGGGASSLGVGHSRVWQAPGIAGSQRWGGDTDPLLPEQNKH